MMQEYGDALPALLTHKSVCTFLSVQDFHRLRLSRKNVKISTFKASQKQVV